MSQPSLLAVHGVRVLGHASAREVGALYGLDAGVVEDHLLDAETRRWVRRPTYVDGSSWSMTDLGREQAERLLAEDLDAQGARDTVAEGHRRFLPLNRRFGPVMTRWQLRRTADDRSPSSTTATPGMTRRSCVSSAVSPRACGR